MKSIKVKEITVRATAGSVIDECIMEGIEMAIKEMQIVRLPHNTDEYLIDPNEILKYVSNTQRKKG